MSSNETQEGQQTSAVRRAEEGLQLLCDALLATNIKGRNVEDILLLYEARCRRITSLHASLIYRVGIRAIGPVRLTAHCTATLPRFDRAGILLLLLILYSLLKNCCSKCDILTIYW